MTIQKLQQAEKEIAAYREEIIQRLLQFSMTDMLLFWGADKELVKRQEQQWLPVLEWARDEFKAEFVKTHGLEVPEANKAAAIRLQNFMESLSDKELAAFYLAALNMRSVLLAAALIKGRLSAEQAYQAAYLEELFQAEKWGSDAEAAAKREERRQELLGIASFLK